MPGRSRTPGAKRFSTGAGEQKLANSHVVLTTGCNRWDQALDVVVEGGAVRVTDDTVLERVAQAFVAKWDGRWQFTARGGCFRDLDGSGEALVFSVAPVKVFAHAKGAVPLRRSSELTNGISFRMLSGALFRLL